MNIYDYIFIFYAVLAALLFGALCIRWYGRTHIEKKSPARALQGDDEQSVLDAISFPQARTGLLDPNWKYTKSEATDVKKTWDKFRPLDPK
jgi:hypothetical protein